VGSAMDEAGVQRFMALAEAHDDVEAVETLMKSLDKAFWSPANDKVCQTAASPPLLGRHHRHLPWRLRLVFTSEPFI
jgi:hypothetical protein